MLERLFKLKENHTTVRTEIIAGSTTFLSMAYIIFVQPSVLSAAGMDFDSVMAATCLSSAIACLMMAFLANYPIALAPGMGENFYFTYAVVLGMGIAWEKALGAVFISGVIFLILSVIRFREKIIEAIPASLKNAIPAAIGILITFFGLVQAGIVIKDPGGGIVTLGDLHAPPTILALTGLAVIVFLIVRNIKGAMLIGMFISAVIGLSTGILEYNGIVSAPPSIAPTFLKLDIRGALELGLMTVLVIFLLMDMCDTVGTFIGVGQATGFMKDGKLPRAGKALLADAIGTVSGAALGTSTVTSYIESTTGVREGGRTGLTAITVAVWMLLALFFSPLVGMIGGGVPVIDADGNLLYKLYPITAPALILVGAFMAKSLKRCEWDDLTEAIPSFMTIVGMALTFNIGHGLAFGFILYPTLKLMAGRGKEVPWLMYVIAGIFLLRYIYIG